MLLINMARKINLPIDYIVFRTNYVQRIVDPEMSCNMEPTKKEQLFEEMKKREITAKPIYVYATIFEDIPSSENVDNKKSFRIEYKRTLLNEDVDEKEIDDLQMVVCDILS